MKKFLISAMLVAACFGSFAKGSSHPDTSASTDEDVSVATPAKYDRAFFYGPHRVMAANDGRMLICPMTVEMVLRSSAYLCGDGNNKWLYALDRQIDGYVPVSYRISFTGRDGIATMIVYYKKK